MRRAFTLIELLIVVAIIGILASIGLPQLIEAQYRVKRAELIGNVSGIQIAEQAYKISDNQFLSISAHPTSNPGKQLTMWTGNAGFKSLGWAPDGQIRGVYSVTTTADGALQPGGDFVVRGVIDVDDDEENAIYTATKSVGPNMVTDVNVY